MKKIRISFPDEKIEALAVLLEDKAPSTCGCLWKALETPVEGLCIHAMWTGREISFPFPGTAFPRRRRALPSAGKPDHHPPARGHRLERLRTLPVAGKPEHRLRFRRLLRPGQQAAPSHGVETQHSFRPDRGKP